MGLSVLVWGVVAGWLQGRGSVPGSAGSAEEEELELTARSIEGVGLSVVEMGLVEIWTGSTVLVV